MKPKFLVLDDFPAAAEIRDLVVSQEFRDRAAEQDGVSYPGIAGDLPPALNLVFETQIASLLRTHIKPVVIFARMMTAGIRAPHRIHSDRAMSAFAAHLYLSECYTPGSGTGFFRHRVWGEEHLAETDVSGLRSECFEDWEEYSRIPAKFGRLLIHDANLWHCAFPLEGFGSRPEDARLVLTMFFNLESQ